MAPCTKCHADLDYDFVQCSSQNACQLHFGPCSGLQEISWRKSDKTTWRCPRCRKENIPIESSSGSSSDPGSVTAQELRSFMAMVTEKLKPIENLQTMSNKIEELQKAVEFYNQQYEDVKYKLDKVEEEQKGQKCKLLEVEGQLAEKNRLITILETRLRDTEQYARNRNIEISGVESTRDEDLKEVMSNIAIKIGVPFQAGDIDIIHRVPTRRGEGPPRIVAQFSSRSTRNVWLKNKHRSIILSKDIVPSGVSDLRVYMNTHLTQEWKHLLWQAKLKGKPKGYKLIWFHDSKIIAKKDVTDTRALIINSEKDLELFG